MIDEFSIEVSGIEEACALLDRVPRDVARVGIARALTAAAVPIVQALEVSTPVRTGELKGSLRTDIALDPEGLGGVASVNFGKQGYIANFVEYGHHMIGHAPGKKNQGQVVPNPFIRRAANVAGQAAVEAFAETLTEALVDGTTWADLAEGA